MFAQELLTHWLPLDDSFQQSCLLLVGPWIGEDLV